MTSRAPVELFPRHHRVGVFRGFKEGGLEFHADISLPYDHRLHNMPMHGQFVLGQLETPEEAVLGRITAISAEGRLSSSAGEQYAIRAVREDREIPDNLKESYLNYRVDIRILGVLRCDDDGLLIFVPSHRRLPHVGSPIAFLSDEVLRHIVGTESAGAEIGHFALGEYIYAAGDDRLEVKPWMRIKAPNLPIKFAADNLVSRRSFVFARAGFGKSNLNKLLFSSLYEKTPTVKKRGERRVPVGTLIFDPDGEYFWPDDKGRPGLCDVPHLRDQVVVFTSRHAPSPFYQSFVAGSVKLDIRRIPPSDIVSIALPAEKQDQQNVRKLRGLNATAWGRLVDLVDRHGNSADIDEVRNLLRLEPGQDFEAFAARANMTSIVRMLHDKGSTLMDKLMEALADGKLCILDISQLRGGPSLILSGLILRRIFDRNQEEFTQAEPRTIPTIAVIEEAQSVLNEKQSAAAPFVEWVKEGRKYDLGALLITQQPGSIPNEILSQGDNWFIFHLLSERDLNNVRAANSHFSKDLLSALLNEPIVGQGIFWSSAAGTPYPISLRTLSFEGMYETIDPFYEKDLADNYANQLRRRYSDEAKQLVRQSLNISASVETDTSEETVTEVLGSATPEEEVDVYELKLEAAIKVMQQDPNFMEKLRADGVAYGHAKAVLKDALPGSMENRDETAYYLVPRAISTVLGGEQDVAWTTERRGERGITYIIQIK